MTVFHGSDREITQPDVLHSRREVDFGVGFYCTPYQEQAENWCRKFIRQGRPGTVSQYTIDEEAFKDCRVLKFAEYSGEWLDFITKCRKGLDDTTYEIVIGAVANDRIFDTIELYFQNLINRSEAIGRLKYRKPNLQLCLRSQNVLDQYVKFERSWRV